VERVDCCSLELEGASPGREEMKSDSGRSSGGSMVGLEVNREMGEVERLFFDPLLFTATVGLLRIASCTAQEGTRSRLGCGTSVPNCSSLFLTASSSFLILRLVWLFVVSLRLHSSYSGESERSLFIYRRKPERFVSSFVKVSLSRFRNSSLRPAISQLLWLSTGSVA